MANYRRVWHSGGTYSSRPSPAVGTPISVRLFLPHVAPLPDRRALAAQAP